MEIRYTRKSEEDFEGLSSDVQRRIAKKMRFFAAQHGPLKFAERLTEFREGEFRFRIGDWRVIFDVKDDTIFVLRIKHRSKAY